MTTVLMLALLAALAASCYLLYTPPGRKAEARRRRASAKAQQLRDEGYWCLVEEHDEGCTLWIAHEPGKPVCRIEVR